MVFIELHFFDRVIDEARLSVTDPPNVVTNWRLFFALLILKARLCLV